MTGLDGDHGSYCLLARQVYKRLMKLGSCIGLFLSMKKFSRLAEVVDSFDLGARNKYIFGVTTPIIWGET